VVVTTCKEAIYLTMTVKIEDIDGYELAVLVVLPVEKSTQLRLIGKVNVPPEFKSNGVPSSA
jgi:hypothetical protein